MSKFKEKISYDNLDERTKQKYEFFLRKVHTSGKTFNELKKMNDKDFAFQVNIKLGKRLKRNKGYSNVQAHRRIINQIIGSKDRKFKTIDRSLGKYEKFGYRLEGLKKIKTELIKTTGSLFLTIAMKLNERTEGKYETIDNTTGKIDYERVYEKTRKLLRTPENKLTKGQKDIYSQFY